MEQYVNKESVVAEIEKLSNNIPYYPTLAEKFAYKDGVNNSIEKVLSTLEVKEVDLEKEISDWENKFKYSPNMMGYKETARHFFELGLISTLTEEDVKLIWTIVDEIPCMAEEDFYKELLKRYEEKKNEYNKQTHSNH